MQTLIKERKGKGSDTHLVLRKYPHQTGKYPDRFRLYQSQIKKTVAQLIREDVNGGPPGSTEREILRGGKRRKKDLSYGRNPTPLQNQDRKKKTKNKDAKSKSNVLRWEDANDELVPPSTLVACPRCNHGYCSRKESLTRFLPPIICGKTVTPAGRLYCCRCGDYYRPETPPASTQSVNTNMTIESPNGVGQLELPLPPPPPIVSS